MDISQEVAQTLLDINAVGIAPDEPKRFKIGFLSPIYIDNRKLPFFPTSWQIVIKGFSAMLKEKKIDCDVIAAIESAGIPHGAALSFLLQKPFVFIRKAVKDHGTKSRIERGDVKGKKVLLIEDLVTTGSSSLSGVEALRQEGAVVSDCFIIVSYSFDQAVKAFADAKVGLHPLTSFPVILAEALSRNMVSEENLRIVQDWFKDPYGWAERWHKTEA